MPRALAIVLAAFGVLLGLAFVRYAPPPPRPADAPKQVFSGDRARAFQESIVGDGASRWIGTEANARARAAIAAELERLGWTVELQRANACSHHGMCAPVTNVVARLVGREPSLPAVLVSAHFDSVLAGPGASDDGVGSAVLLECARALHEGDKLRRTVIALFTDGEESGLLGAEAFVRSHPLASNVRFTVNIDSRGSSGPSQMFETSLGNASLVALLASHLDRPVTTSLFYEVYKRMPNDTDFSITKTIASGVNFANTRGVEHYHTPQDSLTNADRGTLQHHGDNVLAMARAFAETDSTVRSDAGTDAVWFDVMALGIVHFPASWAILIAGCALALVLGQAIRGRAFDRGLASFLAIVPAGAAVFAVGWLAKTAGAAPTVWIAHPGWEQIALHAIAAAVGIAVLFALARKSTPRALWAGTWCGWGALGVATAAVAPGASFLFVVPTVVAAATGALPLGVACAAPAIVAAVLLLPMVPALYVALGFAVPLLIGLPTLFLLTTLAPMLSGLAPRPVRMATLGLAAVAALSVIVAVASPKYSTEIPQRVNVVFRQVEGQKPDARVFADPSWGPAAWGTLPAPMAAALGATAPPEPAMPWSPPAPFVEVPMLDSLKAPTVDTLATGNDGDKRKLKLRIRSARGARTLAIVLPRDRYVDVKVEGRLVVPRRVTGGGLVGLLAVPDEGVIVEIDVKGTNPLTLSVFDRSSGVPSGTKAEEVVRARPKEATASQDGDVTVVLRQLTL